MTNPTPASDADIEAAWSEAIGGAAQYPGPLTMRVFLSLIPQRPADREGWKLVPVEPTMVMTHAGRRRNREMGMAGASDHPDNTYRAMLAASPPAPATPEKNIMRRVLDSQAPAMLDELMAALGGKDAPLDMTAPVTISGNLAHGLLAMCTAASAAVSGTAPEAPAGEEDDRKEFDAVYTDYTKNPRTQNASREVCEYFFQAGSSTSPKDDRDELCAEVQTLREKVYQPGVFKCPKCNFQLVQKTLNATTGNVTSRDAVGEKCPNDGSPMWRVSYQEDNAKAWEWGEAQFARADELRTALHDLVMLHEQEKTEDGFAPFEQWAKAWAAAEELVRTES